MKSTVKRKWINALTNGEYKQVCNLMRSTKAVEVTDDDGGYIDYKPDMGLKNNGMCVLGVLADLALRDSKLPVTEKNWLKFTKNNEWPSARTLKWAEVTDEEVDGLIHMNDRATKTFKQLAKYIEENL